MGSYFNRAYVAPTLVTLFSNSTRMLLVSLSRGMQDEFFIGYILCDLILNVLPIIIAVRASYLIVICETDGPQRLFLHQQAILK